MAGYKHNSRFIGSWIKYDDDIPLNEYCIKPNDKFSIHDLNDGEKFKILCAEYVENKLGLTYYVGTTNRTVETILELVDDNKIKLKYKYKFNGQYKNTISLAHSQSWEGIWRCTDDSIDENIIKIKNVEQDKLNISIQDDAYVLIENEMDKFVPSKQTISDIQFNDRSLSFSVDDNGVLGCYKFQMMFEKMASVNYATKNFCFYDYLYRQEKK